MLYTTSSFPTKYVYGLLGSGISVIKIWYYVCNEIVAASAI